ncbi:interleukin-13 receptor subunit alpha-1 isoform 2-T2 [Fundulus diaphanus]
MTEKQLITPEPPTTSYKHKVWMDGGFLGYSLITVCGGNKSKQAVLEITDPDLVKELDCYVINSTQGHCSWSPVYDATDLRFFYGSEIQNSDDPPTELRECSSYSTTGGVRSGCDLPATPETFIEMVFNATLNDTLVRNTFKNNNLKVKPPPLKWDVKKSKDNFNITWSPPDMLHLQSWKFRLNYTVCDSKMNATFEERLSHKLDRVSHCRYCLSIEAMSNRGNSPPTDEECFDADQDLSFLVYVVIFVIISLAAVTFVCFQRNKENIFPKVPVPRDFLSDISNNNNQSPFRKLYIQAEEEENCKVTLVTNTQTNKPDC